MSRARIIIMIMAGCIGAVTIIIILIQQPKIVSVQPAAPTIVTSSIDRFHSAFIRLIGTAENAKSAAVVVVGNEGVVYIEDLGSWPEAWYGKTVAVTGKLFQKKFIPDPVTHNGLVSAGAYGDQWVLENATWSLLGNSN